MKANSELFDLVKTLNKNEKRYFRLQTSLQKGSKNYIMLFNELDRRKNYVEKEVKKKFSQERSIKQFAFTKNYLWKLIIKNLESFHSASSADSRIHSLISECKILFDKAMYSRYFKTIAKAKNLALKYERFGYYLQILDMEKIIIRKEEIQKNKIKQIYREAFTAIEQLRNTFEYSRLSAELLSKYRSFGTTRDLAHDALIDDILNNHVMKEKKFRNSSRAEDGYYRVKEITSSIRADYEKVVLALEKRLGIVTAKPDAFAGSIINYREDILYSLVDTSLILGRTEEAEKYLDRITEMTEPNEDEVSAMEHNIAAVFIEFRLLLKKGQIKNAAAMIPKLYELLSLYQNKLLVDTELSILFYIVKCRILEGNFPEALKAVNSLMSHPLLDKRADYESYLKIMNLIIHFEMKNYELLRYLIISTYRFLYKERLYRLEMLILEFIRKLPAVKNDDDLAYSFELFRKKLTALKKDKYERNAFEYFDFLSWVEDKIPVKKT
jgi:hypothetical protein